MQPAERRGDMAFVAQAKERELAADAQLRAMYQQLMALQVPERLIRLLEHHQIRVG
jgi:Anti-sigma factor NepR